MRFRRGGTTAREERGRYWDPAGIANARICHSLVGCGQNYTCFEIYHARVTSFSSISLFSYTLTRAYYTDSIPFLPFFSDSCLPSWLDASSPASSTCSSHPRFQTVVSQFLPALRGLLHFIPTTTINSHYPDSTILPRRRSRAE